MAKHAMVMLLRLAALAVLPCAAPVQACAVVTDHEPTGAELRQRAKASVSRATLIVDGEVIEAWREGHPAVIKVAHVLKGPAATNVRIDALDSCDIAFEEVGEKARFVLTGGPGVYSTVDDGTNAREIDRLLKSDRRKVWPYSNPAHLPKTRKP